MVSSRFNIVCAGLFATLFVSASMHAAPAGDAVPTIGFKFDYGPSTYKSELVASNDTSFELRYSLGIYAGETKSIVFMLKSDSNSTTFKLNTSEVITDWQETQLLYRWTYFYIGAVISTLSMKATVDGADLFDLTGTGYGGAFGTSVEFGRGGRFYLDVSSVSISKVTEVNQTTITFGARTDIDVGLKYPLTRRTFDAIFGYRMRTLPVTLTSAATESISTTYLGVSTSLDF